MPSRTWALEHTIPATEREPKLRTHGGYEWIYVLPGRLRMILGEHDIVMGAGEAAEFDTRNPHWFGSSGNGPVEILRMFGKQGERIHLPARTK
ncbi:quercetin dioxygenase-like cupin family protein [Cryobacterium mesophilum]|uniref:cupin domain-containing protein n=1 Tax=Terrimesophilobacter mesophilus TaxID=433647 RepID=UPI001804BCC3|nr:cupin domain-containing protein [Terrimesophilobacter mesophilus]MBB5633416.1 quercetin dioxygenase-like cupin family protein [Terrimesophilobacter mesophilus]